MSLAQWLHRETTAAGVITQGLGRCSIDCGSETGGADRDLLRMQNDGEATRRTGQDGRRLTVPPERCRKGCKPLSSKEG